MKIRSTTFFVVYILVLITFYACKKEESLSPLEPVSGLNSVVDGGTVQLVWQSPSANFDHFELEMSKQADFGIPEDVIIVDKTMTSHIIRGLDLGENYFVRIRTVRNNPASYSDWNTMDFSSRNGNLLLPIMSGDVNGKSVTIKWALPEDEPEPPQITRLVLIPHVGPAIDLPLSAADKANRSFKYNDLKTDTKYTVRIYNDNFLRGTQSFTTTAESVNGVWSLGPHSDLKAAVELSKSGDRIVLKSGVYDFWNQSISLVNKTIAIHAEENAAEKPKVYLKSMVISGNGSGITFTGLDISGSRIDMFKKEIPNTPDTRWNSWLVSVQADAPGFENIRFEDCILRNYYTGILEMSKEQKGKSFTINNSIIHHTGEDQTSPMLLVGAAQIEQGTFTNSTYYMSNKMFINIDREENPSNHILFTFKNNTVDNSWQASAFDFKASTLPTKVLLENNIFSNIKCAGTFFSNFAQRANDFDKRLINCNFFNVVSKSTIYGKNSANMDVTTWELRHPNALWNEVKPAFVMNDADHVNPNSIQSYPMSIDPGYADPANLNFTIPSSNALRAVDAGKPIGDPRWW